MSFDSFEGTFSLILLSLNLQERGVQKLFSRALPYSFTTKQLYQVMKKVAYRIEYGSQQLEIAISVETESFSIMAQQYLDAHFLHCPSERCCTKVSDNAVMQPTAKGVAIIARFCDYYGIDHEYKKTLFESSLNTLKLTHLHRHAISNKPELSMIMICVLFNRLLGQQPRTWTDKYVKDPSPYYHQYLLHPSSNTAYQYYDNDGIRLFKGVTFREADGDNEYSLDYVMSGKALWQWVMDCTDVANKHEAETIVKSFVSQGLVRPIEDKLCDNLTCADDFPKVISRSSMYRITYKGHSLCPWFTEVDLDQDSHTFDTVIGAVPKKRIDLDCILSDPGLGMAFEQTIEKQHANENLRFISDLCDLKARLEWSSSQRQVEEDGNYSMMKLWQGVVNIVYRYIEIDSVLEINIPEPMRQAIMQNVPARRVRHHEMDGCIERIMQQLEPAEAHIRGLLTSMIALFLRDPMHKQLPLQGESPIRRVVIQQQQPVCC